jgi:PTS system glucitol/sorbitol-specific IIC component
MMGKVFSGMVTGIVPNLIVLLTLVNTVVYFVGEEKVNRFAKFASKYVVLRYTVLPVVASLLIPAPMPLITGKFLSERCKPAFYDAITAIAHPFDGLFPWVHPAEIMVIMGLAQGLEKLGLSLGQFFIRAIVVAIIVGTIRAVITERITVYMMKREGIVLDDENDVNVASSQVAAEVK